MTGPDVGEVRRKPRFKLAVNISIHSPSCGLLKGSTLDISEIGIGAVLGEDVPVGEIVKLNIPLPSGPLTICATVRQKSAFFRYGFEFIEPNSVREILESACRNLPFSSPRPADLDSNHEAPSSASVVRKVRAQFQNGNGGVEFSYQLRDLRAAWHPPLAQRKERGTGLVGKRAELAWNVLVRQVIHETAARFRINSDVHGNHGETIGESETAE